MKAGGFLAEAPGFGLGANRSLSSWGDVHRAAFQMPDDHIDRSLNSSKVFVDHFQGVAADLFPPRIIAQKVCKGLF